jgi:hypothetical protein
MAADRFTHLEKIAIFLIAIGEEQTRRFLTGLDLTTVEQVNDAIGALGQVSSGEKASVMIEFADFFFRDKPLGAAMRREGSPKRRPVRPAAQADQYRVSSDKAPSDKVQSDKAPSDRSQSDRSPVNKQPTKPAPTKGSGQDAKSQNAKNPEAKGQKCKRQANEHQIQKSENAMSLSDKSQNEEDSILDTLETLRQRVDPNQIDWGRAGYDFGDGFKGPTGDRP